MSQKLKDGLGYEELKLVNHKIRIQIINKGEHFFFFYINL